ncbi:unnamed protein product [Candidula unifasciata]|uniref:Coiled-coil domain-containing protein 13 n=1 Tax=Candidula unifasciata TaxID=100452 RepID=A0A8S3YD81_9EUPU|nr:unnamed protein product [Candidula unifasciata]
MNGEGHREQFHILQAQQQQKLLERRQKKEEMNKHVEKKTENKETNLSTFGVTDDLCLKTRDSPDDGSYISQDHLSDQIRQLKDENGRLCKLLLEKDFEVRQIKKKIDENRNICVDGGLTNELAATKIIELSKKIRDLTAEKEAEKTRCKQLQKKCHDLQAQSLLTPATMSVETSAVRLHPNGERNGDDDGVDVKLLQDRLKQSETRATDFRNQCLSLRQELKVAHKVLCQEIGENINFQTLLNESSNWRGRAQQILALQGKVEELKALLLDGSATDGEKNTNAKRRQEEKYKDELRKMEKDRKEAQENTAIKLKNLEAENHSLLEKLDAGKARNHVLSNEIKTMKSQLQMLLKKSRNDDEFIDALMKQQSQLKQLLEDHNKQQSQHEHLQQQQLQQMTVRSQHDHNIVEQLKTVAAQKEAQVKMLEMELLHLKMEHMNTHTARTSQHSLCGSDLQPAICNSTRPLTAADITQPQTSHSTRPLTAADITQPQTSHSTRPLTAADISSRKPVTDETHVQEMTSLRFHNAEIQVMNLAIEVEKDKMTELVQVLQERLSEETRRLAEAEANLQAEKRQTVELEKRLAKANLIAQRGNGVSKNLNSFQELGSKDNSELLARSEIQKDEIDSLKAALERTLKAKTEDMKVYSATLEETKKVFLQALRQLKEGQTLSFIKS